MFIANLALHGCAQVVVSFHGELVLHNVVTHSREALDDAQHDQADVARLLSVGVRTVRRVDGESDGTHIDDAKERERRAIGRPAKAAPVVSQ